MQEIRPNHTRAKAAIGCLIFLLALNVCSAAGGIWQEVLLSNASAGLPDEAMLALSDVVTRVMAILQLAGMVITAIVFICWFRRAYFNLHIYNPGAASLSEGWAAGTWFVPFQNLGRPYKIMREIWTGSQSALDQNPDKTYGTGILGAWWAFWIVDNVLGQATYRLYKAATDISSFQLAIGVSIASDVASIGGGLILITIIRRMMVIESNIEKAAGGNSNSIFDIGFQPELTQQYLHSETPDYNSSAQS